jgi:diguanylate cyclase (GGDEF)-like protein
LRLNSKIALILVLPMLALAAVMAQLIHSQVLSRFEALERAQQIQSHQRLLEAIEAELDALQRLAVDWSVYDETYAYMRGENPQYVEANLARSTFENLQVDGIALFDLQHRVHTQRGFEPETQQLTVLAPGLLAAVGQSLAQRSTGIGRGIIEYQGRIAQLGIGPIQDTEGAHAANGYLVMLRFVEQTEVDALARRVQSSLRFLPLREAGSAALPADALGATGTQSPWLRTDDDRQVSSLSILEDLSGTPTLLIQASSPRDIYREGQAAVRQLIGFAFLTLFLFVSATFLAIRQVALKRLSRLSRRLVALGASGGEGERLPVEGGDEIARVARSVNAMLEGLDRAYRERRQASERQRELNALLVRIATDEAVARGDAGALFQVLGGSLSAGASLDAWSLWLESNSGAGLECLRASEGESRSAISVALLQAHLAPDRTQPADMLRLQLDAGVARQALVFPFVVGARRGALCAEAASPQALQQEDECNFLLAATRLIESSLNTHFQNLREQALRQQAELDPLTGLGNRSTFEAGLRRALDRAVAGEHLVGLLFIDLDHFKPINDTHGHAVGDWLLCEVARRLRERVRADDLVARLGGDEFTVVLSAVRSAEAAKRVADKVSQALAAPFRHPLGTLHAGASIGVAWAPMHGANLADLVQAADQAMYAAKQGGRGHWCAADGTQAVQD